MHTDEQQPVEPAKTANSGRFVGYFFLFVLLAFLLYVVPELLIFKQHGFAPVEHIVDAGTPALGGILAGLWSERAYVLNPLNNPLVRFFIVTMVVGAVWDKVQQHTPAT